MSMKSNVQNTDFTTLYKNQKTDGNNNEDNIEKNESDTSSILTVFEEENENVNEFEDTKNDHDKLEDIVYKELKIPERESSLNVSSNTFYTEYKEKCSERNLPPVRALKRILEGDLDELDLEDYRINSENFYLICETINGLPPPPCQIRHLNLNNNQFNKKACVALSELLEMNPNLQVLIMKNCRFEPEGIALIANGIHFSQGISYLNFSNCNMGDECGVEIARALGKNDVCKFVDLSRNHLHIKTASELINTLRDNSSIEIFKLGWNDFYLENETSVKILKGLLSNKTLQELDLSWNGISGNTFSKLLAKVLSQEDQSLRIINLEHNYLIPENFKYLSNAIKYSTTLEEIYICYNVLTSENYFQLIKSAEECKNLKILSLGEYTWLEENVYKLVENVMKKKPQLKIIFKGKHYPNPPETVNFKDLIIKRAQFLAMNTKKKKFKQDFGHFMWNLMDYPEDVLKEDEFIRIIKKIKLQLDNNLINHLIEEFSLITKEKDKKGKNAKIIRTVKIKEMANYYLNKYPTERPPEVPKKKEKKKGHKKKKSKK